MKRYIIFTALLVAVSCGDFLEEDSQNLSNVIETQELYELIQGSCYLPDRSSDTGKYDWIDIMDDNVQETYASNATTLYAADYGSGMHHWTTYPYFEDESINVSKTRAGNVLWSDFYERIFACNVVLDEIERFKEKEPEGYRHVKGEASALRGIYYFYLTNFYGAPYEAAKAATDLGVPVKTTPWVVGGGFPRNTLKECYERITEDLETGVEMLEGVTHKSRLRCNQTAARIYMSRVYLFMGEWQKAFDHASAAVANPGEASLVNYNTDKPTSSVAFSNGHKFAETVFINGAGHGGLSAAAGRVYEASPDLVAAYNENDLRASLYLATRANKKILAPFNTRVASVERSISSIFSHYSLTIAEAYLNKAEAAAMLGDEQTAKETIKLLVECRMKTDYLNTVFAEIDALSGESLVQFIRDERRRETPFRGHRWFDLRRYAVSPLYPVKTTITHRRLHLNDLENTVTIIGYSTLGTWPEDGGWVMPFPGYVLYSNEGKIIDNERPERTVPGQ